MRPKTTSFRSLIDCQRKNNWLINRELNQWWEVTNEMELNSGSKHDFQSVKRDIKRNANFWDKKQLWKWIHWTRHLFKRSQSQLSGLKSTLKLTLKLWHWKSETTIKVILWCRHRRQEELIYSEANSEPIFQSELTREVKRNKSLFLLQTLGVCVWAEDRVYDFGDTTEKIA